MAEVRQNRKPTKRQGSGHAAPAPRAAQPARARGAQRLQAPTKTTPKAKPKPKLPRLPFGKKPAPASAPTGAKPPFLAPSPQVRRVERQSGKKEGSSLPVRQIALGLGVMAALFALAAVVVLVLSHTSAFTITNVTAVASEHVSEDNIVKLAEVPDGATLLNIDEDKVAESVKRNPWVADVHFSRKFPGTLQISVTERKVHALVVMNAGDVVWCLGEGNVWIEPISLEAGEDQDFNAVALAKAQELGALLITDSPASVSPVAGSEASDDTLAAVDDFQADFSDNFASQIVSYSAPSATSVSCILESGVTVSLGAATDVSSKETAIRSILDKYPNRITYINVRVPSRPSYRVIDTEDVTQGTGATG